MSEANKQKKLVKFSEFYHSSIKKLLAKNFGYKNPHEIPKIQKIVLNMGVGKASLDSKILNHAVEDLKMISGQAPVVTKAKKSLANFKLRAGMNIGCKVTLRKNKMYEFLERLIFISLSRIKEFKGFTSKNFDGRGNFNFGIKEQIVFPEITYDKIDNVRGLDINIVTTAKTDDEAKFLLSNFYLPFN